MYQLFERQWCPVLPVAVQSKSHVQLFCNPMDCSLSASFDYGISQARILEWVAISSSRASSWPRDQTRVSCTAGGLFTLSYWGNTVLCQTSKWWHRYCVIPKSHKCPYHHQSDRKRIGMLSGSQWCSQVFQFFKFLLESSNIIIGNTVSSFPYYFLLRFCPSVFFAVVVD